MLNLLGSKSQQTLKLAIQISTDCLTETWGSPKQARNDWRLGKLATRNFRLGLCLDGVVFDRFRHGLNLPSIAVVGVGEVLALICAGDTLSAEAIIWVVPCGSSCMRVERI